MLSANMSDNISMLYGTPAADVAYDMSKLLQDMMILKYEEEPDFPEPVYGELEESNDGLFMCNILGGAPVPEDCFQQHDADLKINMAIEQLKKGVQDNLYPAGSLQREAVDSMIENLEKLQRRELYLDHFQNKKEGPNLVGNDALSKYANMSLIPKLNEVEIIEKEIPQRDEYHREILDEEGKVEKVSVPAFPDGKITDVPDYTLKPAGNQMTAKHSLEELQRGAEKLNLIGLYSTGRKHIDSLSMIFNTLAMQKPASAAQEGIVKAGLRRQTDILKAEIIKAMNVDENDLDAIKCFREEKDFNEVLKSEERGYPQDKRLIEEFEKYLDSALPVSGWSEYHTTKYAIQNNILAESHRAQEVFSNAGRLAEIAEEIKQNYSQLPPNGCSVQQMNAWKQNITESMRAWKTEFQRITQNPKFIEKDFSGIENEKDRANAQRRWEADKRNALASLQNGELHKVGGMIDTLIERVNNPGRQAMEDKRKNISSMMDDMSANFGRISEQLSGYKKNSSPQLAALIEKAAAAGTPNTNHTPQQFQNALENVRKMAEQQNNQEVLNFVRAKRLRSTTGSWNLRARAGLSTSRSIFSERSMTGREVLLSSPRSTNSIHAGQVCSDGSAARQRDMALRALSTRTFVEQRRRCRLR